MAATVTQLADIRAGRERATRWLAILEEEAARRGLPPDVTTAMAAMEAIGVAAVLEASRP